ncbi:molybdate ABC transporter permease subunit [Lactococcus termiticola]|uniref:Molybdenum transport system permease n=1 Tax=Lactococcus termiticola TaxID=2169526 RepID=A0A2R5HH90_9LACT|nr:molybdate ABC transporter permease subunit [Lactococcus termiticola]GBG96715.1 putative molybdate ABC transporter permease protein [Lactococcus termiticola]
MTPIIHSLIVSSIATAIAFILMLPLAYLGAFKRYAGKWLVESLLLLPLVLPPTVVGLYLLQAFGHYGLLGQALNFFNLTIIFNLSGAVIASSIIILPLVYQGLKSAMAAVPKNLIDVAATLSASPFEVLFRVILPNCWPAVLASILLSFSRALGEFGASLMVAGYIPGKTDTIANAIYFAVQNGEDTRALQLSLVNVLFGLLVLSMIYALTNRRKIS